MSVAELQRPGLASHPLFGHCSREELRRIRRWGDEVALPAGQVLLAEDTIPHWFFVVLEGELLVRRGGRLVATAGAGEHVAHEAILGFAPQPHTVVTATPCRLYVIGRRYLISLTYDLRGLQRGLWDDIDEVGLHPRLRQLRAEGTAAWARLPRAARDAAAVPAPVTPPWMLRPARGPVAAMQGAFRALAEGALDRRRHAGAAGTAAGPQPFPRRAVLTVAAVVAVVAAALSLVWHPPVAVVVPGEPVDIGADITVDGAPTHPVRGAYVMATVEFRRPTLSGLLLAKARGQRTVGVGEDSDAERSRNVGRDVFRRALQRAVPAAAAAAGVDPDTIDVRFRSRSVSGSSAALVYALALVDMLDAEDRAGGRIIAATGGLTADGDVVPIAYADEKWQVARAGDADVFLVPRRQGAAAVDGGMVVVQVDSLAGALERLRERE